jgi:hypothetical protein
LSRQKPSVPAITARLIQIKRMVASTKDALPRTAAELRREACEELDELIGDIRGGVANG